MKPSCYCLGGDVPHYTERQLKQAVEAERSRQIDYFKVQEAADIRAGFEQAGRCCAPRIGA